ncbi:cupin domain-containing protein [Pelagibius sp. Alg239-R121]|uniref:JmjC domain-containing protein n=1 Tax=Pelagibius sp. Alg239-R121 TaxID=2993448 RepID=UPI0024A67B76|nr:cupin domain-containing protein [Pelagibius sp. Alg239-R121]
MSEQITSFRQLIDPLPPEKFFQDYCRQRPVHIAGRPEKFGSVMNWDDLNRMLEMAVWTARSLQLSLDKQRIPPGAYCRNTVDRNQMQVLQPESEKIMDFLKRGASLLLNEIETLHPGVRSVLETIEAAHGGRGNANLYCSWKQRQAFDSHYDRHEVYALQIVGEKRWRVYEGRAENPIEHPAFMNVPQAEYDRMKGAVAEELVMRPGDLLYLPRGQFHDALASSDVSVHVTFSCSEPIGLEWLTKLWELAVKDPVFRADLPQCNDREGEERLRRHLDQLSERFQEIARGDEGMQRAVALRNGFTVRRPGFSLPNFEPRQSFQVLRQDLRVVRRGKEWVAVAEDYKVSQSPEDGPLLGWMAEQGRFDKTALAAAFPQVTDSVLEGLLERLCADRTLSQV